MTLSTRPRIPRGEFGERRSRLRNAMESEGIDLFIAYADDRATYGQQHARYLFDYQPHFEPALVIVPRDRNAFIATGPESDHFIQAHSCCQDVRLVDSFTHPDEEYPHSRIERLADMLGELIAGSGQRIAVAGLDALPQGIDQQIRENTDAEIVSGDGLILALRAIKSPAEIEVIRHAYRIAQAGMEAGLAAVARGVTEREIAAEAEYVMRRMGSEGMGIDTIVGAGATHTRPILTRTTFREVGPGDHVLLTIAPRYEGYHGAIGRVATVGEVRREISAAVDTAIAAQDAVRAAMRPGVPGKELDRIARDMCRAADLEQYFAYSGIHSVGVVEFEPPIMTSWYDEPVAEDMVLSVDIPFFFAPWGGLRIEDGFLVSAGGAEPLQTLSREIRRVD